jgi:hypothetical protein
VNKLYLKIYVQSDVERTSAHRRFSKSFCRVQECTVY